MSMNVNMESLRIKGSELEIGKTNQIMNNLVGTSADSSGKVDSLEEVSGKTYGVCQTDVDKTGIGSSDSLIDIETSAQNQEVLQVKKEMALVSNVMSGQDFSDMEEMGVTPEKEEYEKIVTVVDEINIRLAEVGKATGTNLNNLSAEEIEQVAPNAGMAQQIKSSLEKENLPVTEENQSEMEDTLVQAGTLSNLSLGSIKFLMVNQLEPTVSNLYKAQYSGTTTVNEVNGLTSQEFEGLTKQINQVVSEAGLEVNEENTQKAKWLVNNQIPLTAETLTQMTELENLQMPLDAETILKGMIDAIENGGRPKDALAYGSSSIYQRSLDAVEVIQKATEAQITELENSSQTVTIENLGKLQGVMNEVVGGEADTKSNDNTDKTMTTEVSASVRESVTLEDYSNIKAKRQLEELRLLMTASASTRLLRQGITIETTELSKLVEQLKNQETEYYNTLFEEAGLEATEENIDLLKTATANVETMKTLPAGVLTSQELFGEGFSENRILSYQNNLNFSVASVTEVGTQLKSNYSTAVGSYETLMTAPRSDMGDSIVKAFQNVDDILQDLDMEITANNQRAVRILGYNQMEVTQENIEKVKAADQQVQKVISNLTPSTTLSLIKSGVNPLNTNIYELNQTIQTIQESAGITAEEDTEKYSKFLWKLEQNSEITQQERSAYVGIYRLINNIEKSDGAAIGSLVNSNAEISMKNLLTAIRSDSKKGMDISVDDNFGILESVSYKATSITEQIQAGFTGTAEEKISKILSGNLAEVLGIDSVAAEKVQYEKTLSSQALSLLSPESLSELINGSVAGGALNSDSDGSESNHNFQQNLNKFLESTTLESFVESLNEESESFGKNKSSLDKAYYQERVTEFAQSTTTEDVTIKLLNQDKISVTAAAIQSMNSRVTAKGGMYRDLFGMTEDNYDLQSAIEDTFHELVDSLKTPEDMAKAQVKLAETAENVMSTLMENQEVTSLDLKGIKLMRNQIQLSTNLAKEEDYAIPILVQDGAATMSLKIVKGTEDKGKVAITFSSGTVGKVVAELSLSKDQVNGYVASDSVEGLDKLAQSKEELTRLLGANSLEGNVEFIKAADLNLLEFQSKTSGGTATKDSETEDTQVQTQKLYQIARAFVTYFQSAIN